MGPVMNVTFRQIPEFILKHTTKIATWRLCEIRQKVKVTHNRSSRWPKGVRVG